jgi:exodeoxyribonuclease VII large subunit
MSRIAMDAVTVSAYAVKIQVAAKRAGSATVEGEVQKPRKTGGGAFMFDLTDGRSRLSCKVLPRRLRGGISHVPKNGDLVRIQAAHPDFWPQAGLLSVVVEDIELAGDGELLRRREELLATLQREGLTDRAGFPALPRFPRAVGIVAGSDSDALKDVLQGLRERYPIARAVTACCPVQGAAAPDAVVAALARLDLHPLVDVIVVARGGGSVRDLATFDDERVCRAIRALSTPVVTAIGHTDNNPVCNHVTHAAWVPRHAAERVVPDRRELLRDVDDAAAAARRAAGAQRMRIEEVRARFAALSGRSERVRARRVELAAHGDVLDHAMRGFLDKTMRSLASAREAFARTPARVREELAVHGQHLVDFRAAARVAARVTAQAHRDASSFEEDLRLGGRRVLGDHRRNYGKAFDRLAESTANETRKRFVREREGLERVGGELGVAARRGLRVAGDRASLFVGEQRAAQRSAARRRLDARRELVRERAATTARAGRRVARTHRENYGKALDRQVGTMRRSTERALEAERRRLEQERERRGDAATRATRDIRRRLGAVVDLLHASDFRRRGLLPVTGAGGRVIRSIEDVVVGRALTLHLHDGEVEASAERVRPYPALPNDSEDNGREEAQ